jgi:hypothetical protein
VSEIRLIESGIIRDIQWTLEAGGDDAGYWTGLEVTGPGQCRDNGGMAGPKLWGDDLINTYTGRTDKGPVGIAVRTSVAVTRLVLRTRSGDESDLRVCGPGVIDGLRFYVGFAWPRSPSGEFGLDELRGLDDDGNQVAAYDLSFWDRMHH